MHPTPLKFLIQLQCTLHDSSYKYVFTSRVENNVDHDQLATQKPADLDLHCFHSDFIWDFGNLPLPSLLGKYLIKLGKISTKINEIKKIKAIFGLGMTPIYGGKNGQI